MVLGSTLNLLFITSPILGRDELPLIRVCLPGAPYSDWAAQC
jgi:hypothetical protein